MKCTLVLYTTVCSLHMHYMTALNIRRGGCQRAVYTCNGFSSVDRMSAVLGNYMEPMNFLSHSET